MVDSSNIFWDEMTRDRRITQINLLNSYKYQQNPYWLMNNIHSTYHNTYMSKLPINLIRFKKDLRIADHKPLWESMQSHTPVLAIYVRETSVMNHSDYSHFHQYRIQESLKDLYRSLQTLGITMLFRHGEVKECLDEIQLYYHIKSIYAHEETGNNLTFLRDKIIIQYCKENHIEFLEYPNNWVVRKLISRDNRSDLHKERMSLAPIPIPSPQKHRVLENALLMRSKVTFHNFRKVDKPHSWIYNRDIPGEEAAHMRLQYFLTHAKWYRYALSRPEQSIFDSSRLSGYITYGNLSMKQIHQATLLHIKELKKSTNVWAQSEIKSLQAFHSRLFWRCHFIQKLESRPNIEWKNQNSAFDVVRKDIDNELIEQWFYGNTWIPLIDAGMRCLQSTGRINFRMRATLVSFICNTCMQPRQAISTMLARLFLDYEPGIHYSQLQMQAGTTWINTIRIYNPIKQLIEKDSDMTFVRTWVPELASLTNQEIAIMWTEAGNWILQSHRVSYLAPVVDINDANRQARILLRWCKKSPEAKSKSKQVYEQLWSRKASTHKTKKTTIQQSSLFDF